MASRGGVAGERTRNCEGAYRVDCEVGGADTTGSCDTQVSRSGSVKVRVECTVGVRVNLTVRVTLNGVTERVTQRVRLDRNPSVICNLPGNG